MKQGCLWLLLFAAWSASAQPVYKCTNAEGGNSYQSTPCAEGEASTTRAHVAPAFVMRALNADPTFVIRGDATVTRDFTYVANVVDGVLRACEAEGVSGEVFNVATGHRISLNQLLATMNGLLGTSFEAIYLPGRQGDVRDSQADIAKARTRLGYAPIVSFEEGLRHTLDWCRGEMR